MEQMSLTDEDRLWIRELFEAGSVRQMQQTSRVKTELSEEIRNSDFQLETKLLQELSRVRAELIEEIRNSDFQLETKLLTEFHKWASQTDQKIRTHREALRALDLQIERIAARLPALEAERDRRLWQLDQ